MSLPRNVLLTGAGRGIGRGLTRSLLERGHRVFLIDSNNEELANTLALCAQWVKGAEPMSRSGPQAFEGIRADLSDRSQIDKAVRTAAMFFDKKLDILINNAFATPHTFTSHLGSESEDIMTHWDVKLAVGLTAPFLLTRLCVPFLAASKKASGPACIINISSTRAHQAEDDHEAYSAVKAGLLGLTRSSAISLGHRHNIRVNAISPGWISVDNENKTADGTGTQWKDGMTANDHAYHPAGRVGQVEDVAKAVIFLAESPFVTGEEIVLDGGVSRKMHYPE